MNAADEEWGEERLKNAVLGNQGVAAWSLTDRLMVSADTFVVGARQHDDMTLIVLRVI